MIHANDSVVGLSSALYVFGLIGLTLLWSFAKSFWARTIYLAMATLVGLSPAYTEWVGENLWRQETNSSYQKIPTGIYWQWEFNKMGRGHPIFKKQTLDVYVVWICRGAETVKVLVQVKDFDNEAKLRKFLDLSPQGKDIGLKWKIENLTAQIFGSHEPLSFAPATGLSKDRENLASSLRRVGLTLEDIKSVPRQISTTRR